METHTLRAKGTQIKTDGQGESPSLCLSRRCKHALTHTHSYLLTHTHYSDKRPLITQQMDALLITGQPFYKLAYYAVSAWGGSVAGARGSVVVEG